MRLRLAAVVCVAGMGSAAAAGDLLKDHPATYVVVGVVVLLLAGALVGPRLARASGLVPPAPASRGPAGDPGPSDEEGPRARLTLPSGEGTLFGREGAVEEVVARLEEAALVTLLGAGGSGKTRLALAVGERLRSRYDGRVGFIDLLPVEAGQPVIGAVARQLDIPLVPRVDSMETLKAALRSDEMLLVIDNCEHVVEEAGALIAELLAACPGLRVLATSRTALGLAREVRVEVPALPAPDAGADVAAAERSPAVRLFVERARRARSDFALSDANVASVVEICRAVDGLPYALVLVAARVGERHPNDLVAELGESLLSMRVSGEGRHRTTLAATIAWSVQLLDPDEQLLFRRVAVFAGSVTPAGAHAVTSELTASGVREGLVTLCRASLIHLVSDATATRYRLLEVARAFGRQAMEASAPGERAAVERAHAEHMTAVARELAPELMSPGRLDVLGQLDIAYDDIVAALGWTREHAPDLGRRLAGRLSWYWGFRGLLKEGTAWLEGFLAAGAGTDVEARAEVLFGAGNLAFVRGDFPLALERLRESVRASEALEARGGADVRDARRLRGYALTVIGMSASSAGDHEAAIAAVRGSTEMFASIDDRWGLALATNDTGTVLRYAGSPEARRAYEESLDLWETIGDPWGISLTLSNLAIVAVLEERASDARELLDRAETYLAEDGAGKALAELIRAEIARLTGDVESAQAHYRESLRQNRAIDRRTVVVECVDRLGLLAARAGAAEDAAMLFGAADAYREANGLTRSGAAFPTGPRERERERHDALGPLDAAPALRAAYDRGRALDPARAVDRVDLVRRRAATEPAPLPARAKA